MEYEIHAGLEMPSYICNGTIHDVLEFIHENGDPQLVNTRLMLQKLKTEGEFVGVIAYHEFRVGEPTQRVPLDHVHGVPTQERWGTYYTGEDGVQYFPFVVLIAQTN